jgi:hypothetical protein
MVFATLTRPRESSAPLRLSPPPAGAGALPGQRRAASARGSACPGWRGSFPAADTASPSCPARASRRRRCAAPPSLRAPVSKAVAAFSLNGRFSAHCGYAARAICGYAAPVPDGTAASWLRHSRPPPATPSVLPSRPINTVLGTPNPRHVMVVGPWIHVPRHTPRRAAIPSGAPRLQ